MRIPMAASASKPERAPKPKKAPKPPVDTDDSDDEWGPYDEAGYDITPVSACP